MTTDTPDELAELQARCAELQAELTASRDREHRRHRDDREIGERIRAAARRTAQDHLALVADVYVDAAVREADHYIHELMFRANTLGTRPSGPALAGLRSASDGVQAVLKLHRGRESAAQLHARTLAEVTRLRSVIACQAKALHARLGQGFDSGAPFADCPCPGCALIVEMDAHAPDIADATQG